MPSLLARGRRLLPAAAVLAFAACTDAPTGPRASVAAADVRHPILFVHGWNSGASTWNTMVTRFKADGYVDSELHAWAYNSSQSNVTTAQQLKTKVESVLAASGGATRVDIVTHSMGALSARYYLKNLGGTARVDAFVSLGGPNHGTTTAYGCFQTSCVEMRPGSKFLSALNATDETPGDVVRYATWWSSCDDVIYPQSSTPLAGAANTQTACLKHNALKEDATVYAQVRDMVQATTVVATR